MMCELLFLILYIYMWLEYMLYFKLGFEFLIFSICLVKCGQTCIIIFIDDKILFKYYYYNIGFLNITFKI